MLCRQVTGDKIYKIIENINTKDSPGIDEISALDIKLIVGKICVAIANFINVSLKSGIYRYEFNVGMIKEVPLMNTLNTIL